MIQRENYKGKVCIVGYHTQEFREVGELSDPIICKGDDAWLGVGYYFWVEEEFSIYWGEDKKRGGKSGCYDVYKALLEEDRIINAVFSEEGYYYFRDSIEKAIRHLKSLGKDFSLEKVHRWLADEMWTQINIQGIMYDDIPKNPKYKNRVYSEIEPLYYKKRIQIVMFDLKNIHTFALHLEEQ